MWKIEFDPRTKLLTLRLREHVGGVEMRALGVAHAEALEATGGDSFAMLADLRGMHPLDAEAVGLFWDIKRVAASVAGFRGCAVIVDSATMFMQQRRTSLADLPGVSARELVTMDEAEARRFITRSHQ